VQGEKKQESEKKEVQVKEEVKEEEYFGAGEDEKEGKEGDPDESRI
jgi:hypothetical protein